MVKYEIVKYKLNKNSLNNAIYKTLIYRLNEKMNESEKFGKKYFELSYLIKDYLKKSWFKIHSTRDFLNQINNLESIKDLKLICKSRKWLINYHYINIEDLEKLTICFFIGRE